MAFFSYSFSKEVESNIPQEKDVAYLFSCVICPHFTYWLHILWSVIPDTFRHRNL